MPKFRKKPVVIEAEQYFIDRPVPTGVKITYPEIIFSTGKQYFYVSHTEAKDWLSVNKKEDGKPDQCIGRISFFKSRLEKNSI